MNSPNVKVFLAVATGVFKKFGTVGTFSMDQYCGTAEFSIDGEYLVITSQKERSFQDPETVECRYLLSGIFNVWYGNTSDGEILRFHYQESGETEISDCCACGDGLLAAIAGALPEVKNEDYEELQKEMEQIDSVTPTDKKASNIVVWIGAFAPIWSDLLAALILKIFAVRAEYADRLSFYIILFCNVLLFEYDEFLLKDSGKEYSGNFGWLIPVYLWKRSTVNKDNRAYFICWCVSFAISIFLF